MLSEQPHPGEAVDSAEEVVRWRTNTKCSGETSVPDVTPSDDDDNNGRGRQATRSPTRSRTDSTLGILVPVLAEVADDIFPSIVLLYYAPASCSIHKTKDIRCILCVNALQASFHDGQA